MLTGTFKITMPVSNHNSIKDIIAGPFLFANKDDKKFCIDFCETKIKYIENQRDFMEIVLELSNPIETAEIFKLNNEADIDTNNIDDISDLELEDYYCSTYSDREEENEYVEFQSLQLHYQDKNIQRDLLFV